jgi:hypothetical protein
MTPTTTENNITTDTYKIDVRYRTKHGITTNEPSLHGNDQSTLSGTTDD